MSNRYLDKVAGVSEYGHMARAALDVAAKNPMTVAFGAGGALDGALSTVRQGREGDVRLALRGARNTIVGGAKGAAAGKALELGYQHLKGMAAERAANKYLHKTASMMAGPRKFADGVYKTWQEIPIANKISLGLGTTGLGISVANYASNKGRGSDQAKQIEVHQQSLNVLKRIHKTLNNPPAQNNA